MKRITVYGTLLSGFGNWKYYLNNKSSKLLGEHTINDNLNMVSLGGFPGLVPSDDKNNIAVETYEVDDDTYKGIEMLEGYPHFYDKKVVNTPFGESEIYVLPSRYADKRSFVPKNENGIISWKEYRNNINI